MPCISSHDASSPRPAKGFTLVELLVSITILVILATVTLYGMASVQKMAQIQRAKSQVARIHELIMDKWESYETRRAGPLAAPYDDPAYPPNDPWPIVFRRLLGLRELMRLEMPDRYSDISPGREMLDQRPGLSRYYERRLNGRTDVQPAECLYMIISRMSVGDASALEFFSEEEIGDADGDGLPEILDPWGTPIAFIRWPAGFAPSPLMSPDDFGDPFDLLALDDTAVITGDPLFDRDRDEAAAPDADDRPFALVPLIMSAGPDGAFDIDIGDIDYSSPEPPQKFPNDPYAYIEAGAGYPPDQQLTRVGAIADTNQDGVPNHLDNIHNHLISTSIK